MSLEWPTLRLTCEASKVEGSEPVAKGSARSGTHRARQESFHEDTPHIKDGRNESESNLYLTCQEHRKEALDGF